MKNYSNNSEIEIIKSDDFGTNTYVIISSVSSKAFIVDPADGEQVESFLEARNITPHMIVNTHGHYDHISGNKYLRERYSVPVAISAADSRFLTDPGLNMSAYFGNEYVCGSADILLYENRMLELDNIQLIVHEVPGHTEGSIALQTGNMLFSGDLIFRDGIGRTDLPGGDIDTIMNTLKTFYMKLKFDTVIFPGHGDFGNKAEFDNAVQQFFYAY